VHICDSVLEIVGVMKLVYVYVNSRYRRLTYTARYIDQALVEAMYLVEEVAFLMNASLFG
jgi:hypothetical protein